MQLPLRTDFSLSMCSPFLIFFVLYLFILPYYQVNALCSTFEETICPNQFDPLSVELKRCATELMQILVRSHFASKVVLDELRLSEVMN